MTVFTSSHIQFHTANEKIPMSPSTCISQFPFSFLVEPRTEDSMMEVASDLILIVDDDAEVRTFLRKGLEAYGYGCQEAENGLAALRKIRTQHYGVILTDLNMPFLDGLGLAQHLREDPSLGNPLVIMMTSSPTDLVTRLAVTFGIQEVLSKPCLPSDVNRIIHPQQITFPWAA